MKRIAIEITKLFTGIIFLAAGLSTACRYGKYLDGRLFIIGVLFAIGIASLLSMLVEVKRCK